MIYIKFYVIVFLEMEKYNLIFKLQLQYIYNFIKENKL